MSYMSYVSYMSIFKDLLKSLEIGWFFFFKFGIFCSYIKIKNLNYENENTERKFLKIMQKNQCLKVKNSLLELEKDFIELKDIELKDREVKIKRLNQLLCLYMKWIGLKKRKWPAKNTWYDWLIK